MKMSEWTGAGMHGHSAAGMRKTGLQLNFVSE